MYLTICSISTVSQTPAIKAWRRLITCLYNLSLSVLRPTATMQTCTVYNDHMISRAQETNFQGSEIIQSASNADGEYLRQMKWMARAAAGTARPCTCFNCNRSMPRSNLRPKHTRSTGVTHQAPAMIGNYQLLPNLKMIAHESCSPIATCTRSSCKNHLANWTASCNPDTKQELVPQVTAWS